MEIFHDNGSLKLSQNLKSGQKKRDSSNTGEDRVISRYRDIPRLSRTDLEMKGSNWSLNILTRKNNFKYSARFKPKYVSWFAIVGISWVFLTHVCDSWVGNKTPNLKQSLISGGNPGPLPLEETLIGALYMYKTRGWK